MLITIKQDNKAIDIKVNEKQKVLEALEILDKKDLIHVSDVFKIRSLRNDKVLIALKSFKDNDIYNGDVLEIENSGNS